MRVTGGRLAGRRIAAPSGRDVRPTSDRVRESLFARLGELTGARVLDLYAGSGALGIEALSRRDFARAARHFAEARVHAPSEAGALLLELYARGREGDPQARALFLRARRGVGGQPELVAALRWLGREFGWEGA